VTEAKLKEAFVKALNCLITDRDAILEDIRLLLPKLADTAALEKELTAMVQERDEAWNRLQRCVEENASIALDQQEYNERYEKLMSEYEAAKEKVSGIEEKLRQRTIRCETLRQFIAELEERAGLIIQFDEAAWLTLAERVTITVDGVALFRFKSGTEIGIKLR
jgi:chromosome segregation ATPase